MKFWKKMLCILLALLLLCCCLTGCNRTNPREVFDLVLWLPFVYDDVPAHFEEMLENDIPALDGIQTAVLGQSIGYLESDAAAYMAYAMKLTAMASCGEVDMLIMDPDTALGAARSSLLIPLSDLFTPEELEALDGRLMDFEEVDAVGNPLGTRTPVCGIDISDFPNIHDLLGPGEFGIYAVTDLGRPEVVKAVMSYFAEI